MKTGSNARSVIVTNGGRNFTASERDPNDYYATPPAAVPMLLRQEKFDPVIWECACGGGICPSR